MADLLDQALKEIASGAARPLYLVHGEEFLARRAAEALCHALVPEANRDLNLVVVDGSAGGREVAQHLDTVPMFRGTKVVMVEAADVLLAPRDLQKELDRARELWGQKARRRDAARRVLSMVAAAGWTWRELAAQGDSAPTKTRWKKEVGLDPTAEERTFLAEVGAWAGELELKAPRDDQELLTQAVTRGPPPGNHLVLLCEAFEERHPVVRAVVDRGLVLSRQPEQDARKRGYEGLDIGQVCAEVLGPLGKRLTPGAQQRLKDRVGAAMRLLAGELEKLALYVGDRPVIEERDVELLVAPYREEEYFELSNAIGDGDAGRAIKLVSDELGRGKAGILVAAGITGVVRRLATEAARYVRIPGALPGRDLSLRDYQATLFPRYVELLGGKQPNPYGPHQNYLRVRRLGARRLFAALATCAQVDMRLKRGGDAAMELERLLLGLCGQRR